MWRRIRSMNDAITAPSMISELLWLTGSSMERHAKFFGDKYNLKNIFGTDIHIERPPRKVHEDADVNRKVFHSLNAQIICGANFEILHVGVSTVGSTDDGCARTNQRLSFCFEKSNSLFLVIVLIPWVRIPSLRRFSNIL